MQVSSDQADHGAASRIRSARAGFAAARTLSCCFFLVAISAIGHTQPPGTLPPRELITDSVDGSNSGEGLEVDGFVYLDVNGNDIFMPRMTYERMRQIESGSETSERPFAYKSLQITGTADGGRAELDLQLQLSIDSTGGRLIPIPLRMANFHLLRAPEFTSKPAGLSENNIERMTIGPDGSGYVLWVRADRPRETTVKMQVSSRVDQSSRDSLDFRLPDVSARINISVPDANAVAEINGRGDEVLGPPRRGEKTEFQIVSGGGNFQLNWGQQPSAPANSAQFEVETTANVSWNAPQDRPTMTIQWRIRSLRDRVSVFDFELPEGAELDGIPTLVPNQLNVSVTNRQDNGRYGIVIPNNERGETIDLSLKLTLAKPTVDGWLNFQIPRVIGALRHDGMVVLKTIGDYRLRWRSSQGIQRTLNNSLDETPGARAYSFQFDRDRFVMPIMLSAQQQKLRLTSNSEIILGDSSASLEMTIKSSGGPSDSREIEIDFADWDQRSVFDAESGEDLITTSSGSRTQVSLTPDSGGQASMIRVTAQRSIAGSETIDLTLPRIVADDETLLIENNDVTIRSNGRSGLVVDLEKSESLEAVEASGDQATNGLVSQFRVQPPREKARLVGSMVQQRPQLTLEANGSVTLEGSQLVTTVDWVVTSRLNLKGRLDVAIPQPMSAPSLTELAEAAGLGNYLNGLDESAAATIEGWTVTINGRSALLQATGRDLYQLKSGVLAEGTYTIRWHNSRPVAGTEIQTVALPRLRNADVEVRGDINVSLQGNYDFELYAADSTQRDSLQYGATPREPLRLRLVKRATSEQELSVRRAVLRTAVSRKTRHEQVLAVARGGEAFRVSLSDDAQSLKTDAYVDRQQVTVHREEDSLSVRLPDDQKSHVIDIRVWADEPSSGVVLKIQPLLKLPVGVGRVFWQIVLPEDSHVVWVSPTTGQAMTWQRNRWLVERQPVLGDEALCERIGAVGVSPMPPGNRYLYVGSDILSFEATAATRATIWLFVGGFVLFFSAVLAYVPALRKPITAMVAAFLFAGLLAMAPDAAVLVGQFAGVAIVLVIIMLAIRSLLAPHSSRLFSQPYEPPMEGSTKTAANPLGSPGSSIRSTQNVQNEPSGVSP